MSDEKLHQSLENLDRALDRLSETQGENPDDSPFLVDASIQRFEFCLELYWKTFKRALAFEGVETTGPRSTLKHAFQQNWLRDETIWLDMLDDRNRSSHVYNEQAAQEIFGRIKAYVPEMRKTFEILRRTYPDE